MSEQAEQVGGASSGADRQASYQPPKLTVLGNARDLLAGGTGTLDDSACGPLVPTRNPDDSC